MVWQCLINIQRTFSIFPLNWTLPSPSFSQMTVHTGFFPHYKEIRACLDRRVTQSELWLNAKSEFKWEMMKTWKKMGCFSMKWSLVLIVFLQEWSPLMLTLMNKTVRPIFHQMMVGWERSMRGSGRPCFSSWSVEADLVNIFSHYFDSNYSLNLSYMQS